ncbi:MAG: DEAD/DEAH box helicase, partial [Pseudomonadota bacterium]
MSFSSFGLAEEIVRATEKCGYTNATPIQTKAIPAVLSGKDLLARAQTGTGKTAGFVLPILHKLSDKSVKGPSSGRPPIRALILTPTRELATQIQQNVNDYGQFLKLDSMAMFGGASMHNQLRRLRSRVDILVATPGRLLDHLNRGTVDLSKLQVVVLDEADRMLDMGFIKDVRKILAKTPKDRQNLLFSATFSKEIEKLAKDSLRDPVRIQVAPANAPAEGVEQTAYRIEKKSKSAFLRHLIAEHNWYQVLVFMRTKHGANKVTSQLLKSGVDAAVIHGGKRQNARTKALEDFKKGKIQVLVATDIAARGLDINNLPMVINFD